LEREMSGEPLAPSRQSWLRISVRGLIILVLVIGGWLGWIVNSARVQHDAVVAIQRAGGFVQYDWQWRNGDYVQGQQYPPWPRWLVDRIGVDFFSDVTLVNLLERGSNEHLRHVGRLGRLERLNLHGAPVTDVGLTYLKGLMHLQILDLDETRVTDAGLVNLTGMSSLKSIALSGTGVTDLGIDHLKRLMSLRELVVYDSRITDVGLEGLRQALPGLQTRSR
jgi:Leucine Rich repeat